jgi:predicted nucleic acid-binding protein
MSASFVVDCSIAMAWLFHDEATPKTTALLSRLATESALVPAWWFVEITNVLAMAERKGRITARQSDAFIADLRVGSSVRRKNPLFHDSAASALLPPLKS